MDREGRTYKNKVSGALIVVINSKPMSSGTTRHTVLVLDEAGTTARKAGDQTDIDEVPVQKWDSQWEAV